MRRWLEYAAIVVLLLPLYVGLYRFVYGTTDVAVHQVLNAPQTAPAITTTTRLGGSPGSRCTATGTSCARMLVGLMNAERAQDGVPSLTLDWTMTHGTPACVGARGHAREMAAAGQISHDQFPTDVCGYGQQFTTAEENVGMGYGTKGEASLEVHQLMAAEPIGPGISDHHTNWLSPAVSHVGIAFAHAGGAWYVSEEFAG